MSRHEREYAVGFGKPPLYSRFGKGRSGTRRDDRNALGTWSPWSKQSRRSRANSAAIVRVRIRLSPPPKFLIFQDF